MDCYNVCNSKKNSTLDKVRCLTKGENIMTNLKKMYFFDVKNSCLIYLYFTSNSLCREND